MNKILFKKIRFLKTFADDTKLASFFKEYEMYDISLYLDVTNIIYIEDINNPNLNCEASLLELCLFLPKTEYIEYIEEEL